MTGDRWQFGFHGAEREHHHIAAHGLAIVISDDSNREIDDRPIALAYRGVVDAARQDRPRSLHALSGVLKAIGKDQCGGKIRDGVRRRRELDRHQRNIRVVGKMEQAVEVIRD